MKTEIRLFFRKCDAMIRLILTVFVLLQGEGQPNFLTYGAVVFGTITDDVPQVRYTFEGKAGDVVAIEMLSADRSLSNPFSEPVLILLDGQGVEMQSTQPDFPVDDTLLITELPTDGLYTIITTRDENVERKSVGAFELRLKLVKVLKFGHEITDIISNEQFGVYYGVRVDRAFEVIYERIEGAFWPEVSVHVLTGERSGYDLLATASGRGLKQAVLGIFEPEITSIVIVREAPFDYYGEVVQVEFGLRIDVSDE